MQQPLSMMLDADDGVEPQFKVVDKYYFEHNKDEPVCFSVLPLHFDNNEEVVSCDSEKNVYLRGVLDKSLYPVHKRVVAWRVELDCEHPKIFVLSSEGNWITILKPLKCYEEKIAHSILITVQVLHCIKKQSSDRLWARLWDHLYEVFKKLDSKPTMDDLRKHCPVIKLFVEREPALNKSKVLRRITEDTTGKMKELNQPKTRSSKAQSIVSFESRSSSKDDDDKNDCDCSYNYHDSNDEYSYSESSTEDDYSYDENNNSDDSSDGDNDGDDCTDAICAICDDGGKLVSCIGHCKRSFHPRVKDGRESKCRTLGYTSSQLKGISVFLCQNCKYKQHQCFKCGELEPSDELNAKVFKCNNASCGHFYHPKCVAKLLEPDDGACELAKRIMSGMSFTCPVHWCFKCGKMEDRTQRALQFAVCRRCPKSYHRECLPRNISFESKGKCIKQRAWELSDNILIYCRDHRIYMSTGTAGRNHIKLPCVPEVSKTNYPAKKKVKRSSNRKMDIHQSSIKSTELPNRSYMEDMEKDPKLTVTNPEHVTKCLKEKPQFEPTVVASDASPGSLASVKGPEKQFSTSPFAKGSRIKKISSCVIDGQLKNRVTSKADKETFSGISHDIARKHFKPSTLSIYGRTCQDILSGNSLLEKDAEWVRIAGDKDDGERDETSEYYAGEENGAPNKDFHENHEQNDVLDKLPLEKHAQAEGRELRSGKEGGMERGDNAYEHDSVPGQEQDTSTFEQVSGSEKGEVTSNGSNKCGPRSDKVAPDHIDDCPRKKPLSVAHVDMATIIIIKETQPQYECGEDQEVNRSYDCQVEQNSSQSNKNPKPTAGDKLKRRTENKETATDGKKTDLNKNRKYNHIKNGSEDRRHIHAEAHSKNQCLPNHRELDALNCKLKGSVLNDPRYNDEDMAADILKSKSRGRTVPNRRDGTVHDIRADSSNSPVSRNARKRLRNYSPGQEVDRQDNYPGGSSRHRYEHKRHVNYPRPNRADGRQRNPWESTFVPSDFGAGRRQSPPPYQMIQGHSIARGPDYVLSRRHSSPSYPRALDDINYTAQRDNFHDLNFDEYRHRGSHVSPVYTRGPDYGSNGRYTPPFAPRSPDVHPHGIIAEYGTHHPRSEDVAYTPDWNSLPRVHYDQYDEYGGYGEMNLDPIARYSLGNKNDGAYRPGLDFRLGERTPFRHYEGGSITDKYAPRLDQTNRHQIGQSSLHYDPPVRW